MREKLFKLTLITILLLAALPSPLKAAESSKVYRRVISLYAAHTEVLLRLGARDSLIGVSAQESYQGPETEGWKKPPVFSIRDDAEKFLAAKPDLVLVRPMHLAAGSSLVAALKRAGIRVYSAQVLEASQLYQYWRNLAELVGKKEEAEKMIGDFDAQISAYYQAASRRPESEKPGVFLEAIHSQIKTFTPGSIPVWLVELAGGRNVAADAAPSSPGLMVADYGPERLLAKAKEVDIFISQAGAMNPSSFEQVKDRSIYQPLKAFQDGRVYKISEDILARPTPSLLLGLAQIAEWTGLQLEPASPGPEAESLVDLPPDQKNK